MSFLLFLYTVSFLFILISYGCKSAVIFLVATVAIPGYYIYKEVKSKIKSHKARKGFSVLVEQEKLFK